MQIATIEVRLAGSRENTVVKCNVTPPEIVILRAMHGDDSVQNIQPTSSDRRSHQEEHKRLLKIYGSAKDTKEVPWIEKLYPGHNPLFPVNLSDIGFVMAADGDPQAVVERPKRGRKPRAEAESEQTESETASEEGESKIGDE